MNKRLKICVIGLRGIPNIMGGIETHVDQIYSKMTADISSAVVLARSPYVKRREVVYGNIEVIPIFTIKSKFFETFIHTFICILYARIFIKPDVLHLHAIGPSLFAPFAKLLGLKVLVTHHGADYNRAKWSNLAKKVLRLGEYCAIRYADKIIVVGRSLTEQLKSQYPKYAEKLSFIPNGCPPVSSSNVANQFPNDIQVKPSKYILYVGRLVPEKGVHDLIEAYNNSKLNEESLLIVGDADFQDDYYKDLKKMKSEKVIFAGKRTGDELKAIYKNASLFVLPSYHEGLPIVALEALSFNIPVLLSDIGPNLDVDLPSDNYFKTGDTQSLACKLIDRPKKINGHSLILEKFDWQKIANATFNLLEDCAK